ncbi:MAG TPA: trypsin-like peptidase domain-containing protein [Candidatus Aquicultor sp.]
MEYRTRRGYSLGAMIATVALASAILGGIIATMLVPLMYGSSPSSIFSGQPAISAKEIIKVNKDAVSPVTAVAKKMTPSVVNIRVGQNMHDKFHPDVVSGAGTGVIFSKDGYIITNNHVVSDAKNIYVTIGTEEVKGKLVAADKEVDLAVLKVDKTNLPAAEFGSTKHLQVGEIAVAIGSPFGFEKTVTSGIISALNRTVTVPEETSNDVTTYTNLIQTDAPINPGNSGGALGDAQGRVIGINTLIVSSSGVTEGVGFAIPVETAVSVARQLIKLGKASHPYIGIVGQNVDQGYVQDKKVGVQQGAYVIEIVKGGPAAKAGLKAKDIILSVDASPIDSMDDLIAEIRQKKVGDTLTLIYIRNGKREMAKLVLAEKPPR